MHYTEKVGKKRIKYKYAINFF